MSPFVFAGLGQNNSLCRTIKTWNRNSSPRSSGACILHLHFRSCVACWAWCTGSVSWLSWLSFKSKVSGGLCLYRSQDFHDCYDSNCKCVENIGPQAGVPHCTSAQDRKGYSTNYAPSFKHHSSQRKHDVSLRCSALSYRVKDQDFAYAYSQQGQRISMQRCCFEFKMNLYYLFNKNDVSITSYLLCWGSLDDYSLAAYPLLHRIRCQNWNPKAPMNIHCQV